MQPGRRTSETLSVDSSIQVVAVDGVSYVCMGDRTLAVEGVDPAVLRALLATADGSRTADELCAALSGQLDPTDAWAIVDALVGTVLLPARASVEPSVASAPTSGRQPAEPGVRSQPVAIIGNGALQAALHEAFVAAGYSRCRAFTVGSFASCSSPAFLAERAERVLAPSPGATAAGSGAPTVAAPDAEALAEVTVADLAALCRDHALVVCALEGVPYRGLLDLNRACLESSVPCLFITVDGDDVLVGPTLVPGTTACFACRELAVRFPGGAPERVASDLLPLLTAGPIAGGAAPRALLEAICGAALDEAEATLGPAPRPLYGSALLRLTATGERRLETLFPRGDCAECQAVDPPTSIGSPARSLAQNASTDLGVAISRAWTEPPDVAPPTTPDAIRRVCVLGGGTAGYLTAMGLRARLPHLEVTLIESSKIPIIGVGEASTPELVKFLHSCQFLGLDVVDFYRRVLPSLKLGIRFYWGPPGDTYFNFPFQRGCLLESQLYDGSTDAQSLGSLLTTASRAPVVAAGDEEVVSLLPSVRFAYHLDNRRFVRYLQEEAPKFGVRHLDRVIADAALTPGGESIDHLITEDGERLAYDLYIDCSGFRSFLLEKKLGSPFLSYASSLYTDRAVAGPLPHDGTVKTYTLAETMDNGWAWNISFEDGDHRGYVFSSAFCSDDQAVAEMKAKNPGMRDLNVIPFRCGRHEHFWKGNVIAMGNSYGFVEPLESTSLHMIVLQVDLLTTHFPSSRRDRAIQPLLNRKVATRWDALRWFLSLHYKYNRKLDTPFWRAMRADVDISGAEERVAIFQERAPLSYRTPLFYQGNPPDFFSDDHSFDTLLFGQQVPARYVEPREDRASWSRKARVLREIAGRALPSRDALSLLRDRRPDLLAEFVDREDSWVHRWLPS